MKYFEAVVLIFSVTELIDGLVIHAARILRSQVLTLRFDCGKHKFLGLVRSIAVGVPGQRCLK